MKDDDVFINCPFDFGYRPLFERILFTVLICGFRPRCAWELADGKNRINGILDILGDCRLSIHDLSKSACETSDRSCRFNMPFELGLDYALRAVGSETVWRDKRFLVMENGAHSLRRALSDINELDPKHHERNFVNCIRRVRDFLRADVNAQNNLPGQIVIERNYESFDAVLTNDICVSMGFDRNDIDYRDLVTAMVQWLRSDAALR
ncbi:MAG TPA: hypothetical protein PLV61_05995 [Parvularculaceae bacterium]|nr:hypothetical protein [Caulobacterales bacterium]HPE30729.1 hypothetical protein [Parvularculaceae bacterium]